MTLVTVGPFENPYASQPMTSRPELTFNRRRYAFRSPGVFTFLDVMRRAAADEAKGGWVSLAAMAQALPGQGPRQFARYVDMLADAGLPLVEWETKTRGPWRLAVQPSAIRIRTAGTRRAGTTAAEAPGAAHSLDILTDAAWVEWTLLLAQGNMAIHDGSMDEAEQAFRAAKRVSAALPAWADSIAEARIAHLLLRRARYRDAARHLRRLETLCSKGLAARSAANAMPLLRAKFHYDRGRLLQAEQALACGFAPQDGGEDPYALNMRALIAGRRYWTEPEGRADDGDLALALEYWLRAIGAVLVRGETALLDALCYNLANNILRGVARRALPPAGADTALRWLAMNMFLCRKLGLGGDSILIYLLLMDTWLEYGLSPEQWPAALRDGLNLPQSPKGVLTNALQEARTTNMPLELALCLKRQMLLADSPDTARAAYEEAAALLADLGQREELRKLRTAWKFRCSTPGAGK